MRRIRAQFPVTQVTRFVAAIAFVLIVACGTSPAASGPDPVATTAATTAAASTAATSAPGSTASAATVAKVSANNATNAQLIAAFTAAGIPNPSSWAREVQEYRPYDTNDANLTKLRQNLVKYNPAAGVVDKIVATLSLP
jgi:hypothetical protein